MRTLLPALAALVLAVAALGLLTSEPGGPVQLAVTALCALLLQPADEDEAPSVIELDDAGLLWHLVCNPPREATL